MRVLFNVPYKARNSSNGPLFESWYLLLIFPWLAVYGKKQTVRLFGPCVDWPKAQVGASFRQGVRTGT